MIQVIQAFAGNNDVVFGDVNLSDMPGLRRDYNPGAGGWPTVLYFNSETGVEGGVYKKKTDMSMCDELGPNYDYMEEYVEEYGNTSLCNIEGTGCDDRSVKFIEKMKAKDKSEWETQSSRLQNLLDGNMKADLKDWVKRRLKILTQLSRASSPVSTADEL